ncbi:MAG TPA: class I SAM-dependent methyltransferase [Candidatus Binataceae bacterium]|nr:class I SAM-dependent methyltransferase [Candidatus Binataceae bacterium]
MDREIYIRMAEVEDDHWWFSGRRIILDSMLARTDLPKDAAILEAGCGTGGNLRMLSRRGSVCAMELDQQACEFARSRAVADVARGKLPDQIPFGNRNFDVVLLIDVLEHLDDDGAALGALRERIKPGGILLATVPAFQLLWSPHDVAHHHRRRYRAGQLREVVSEAGFDILYLSYYNTMLFAPILAARVAQRLTGRHPEDHGLKLPPRPVNWALRQTFAAERLLLRRVSFPVGVSLIVLARNAGLQMRRSGDQVQTQLDHDRVTASA